MRSHLRSTLFSVAPAGLSLALLACAGGAQPTDTQGPMNPGRPDAPVVSTTVDYEQALRSAAIKLTGNYPSLAEIKKVRDASEADRPGQYAEILEDYLSRPTFAVQLLDFFRDTFKMGEKDMRGGMAVNLDYAPTYATMLVVKEQPLSNLVTAVSGTCQTLNEATGEFSAQNCPNQAAVGVLTDAGVQAQFFSSMAFRRVRWVQETLLCRKFPAEIGGNQEKHPGGTYASPWPYGSITGEKNTKNPRIDFQDDKSIICANCHSTMNHIAPLFAKFSPSGALTNKIQVKVPVPGEPTATLGDFLPNGETTAWRFGQPVSDLAALGAAIAADPEFSRCMVTRMWNWAMSRPDVVEDQATLTDKLAMQLAADFTQNSWNGKRLLRAVFKSESFIRY
jgi:hypothetical protein